MIHLLLKTTQFIPDAFEPSIFDIDFQKWYDQGKRLIVSDLDNTLISYEDEGPTQSVLGLFEDLEDMGFEVIIMSNNVPKRMEVFIKGLEIKGVANARKPLIRHIKKELVNHKLDEVLLVGDQLMTDVWAAKRLGASVVLVNPIKRKTEKWYTRFNRKIEVKMLQKIKRKYPKTYQELKLDERR
ncbi:MAG: YqeG family HAD IIIA-type phosphatase [Candidatus Izemoplasma sp.]|nr:YqeG family HAD IIIA-type phosphatase [Candidatus Izemoplasma sp.]